MNKIAIFFFAGVLFFGCHLSQAETGDNLEKNELLAIGASTVVGGNSAAAKKELLPRL